MSRNNVQSFRLSRAAQALGECASNLPTLLSYLSAATLRLKDAGGEVGWWGSWDRVLLTTSRDSPFVVAPSNVSRIINAAVCRTGIKIQNSFYEVLEDGVGLREDLHSSGNCRSGCCNFTAAYDRLDRPFQSDFTTGSVIRIYPGSAGDIGKRVFIGGTDTNGRIISSVDNGNVVPGVFMILDSPYVDTPLAFETVTTVQKDQTLAAVTFYQVNADTTLSLLAIYQPTETSPTYRRYFMGSLPNNCCGNGATTPQELQVTAMVKLEFTPYTCDVDPLLIGNIEALKHACMSIRYEEMDTLPAKQMAQYHWTQAIKILNHELDDKLGKEQIATNFSPFGRGTRRYQMIGQNF